MPKSHPWHFFLLSIPTTTPSYVISKCCRLCFQNACRIQSHGAWAPHCYLLGPNVDDYNGCLTHPTASYFPWINAGWLSEIHQSISLLCSKASNGFCLTERKPKCSHRQTVPTWPRCPATIGTSSSRAFCLVQSLQLHRPPCCSKLILPQALAVSVPSTPNTLPKTTQSHCCPVSLIALPNTSQLTAPHKGVLLPVSPYLDLMFFRAIITTALLNIYLSIPLEYKQVYFLISLWKIWYIHKNREDRVMNTITQLQPWSNQGQAKMGFSLFPLLLCLGIGPSRWQFSVNTGRVDEWRWLLQRDSCPDLFYHLPGAEMLGHIILDLVRGCVGCGFFSNLPQHQPQEGHVTYFY